MGLYIYSLYYIMYMTDNYISIKFHILDDKYGRDHFYGAEGVNWRINRFPVKLSGKRTVF